MPFEPGEKLFRWRESLDPVHFSGKSLVAVCQVPSKLAALLPEVQGVDSVKLRWSPPLDAATAVADLQILSYKILVSWCLAVGWSA